MAALFYTNHRMKDVTSFFSLWRQLTSKKQNQQWNMQPDEEAHIVESSAQKRQGRGRGEEQEKISDEFMSSSYKRRN